MAKLDRNVVRVSTVGQADDDGYMAGDPATRMGAVWDITVALWSVATNGRIHAHTRLSRDIAVLRKGRDGTLNG